MRALLIVPVLAAALLALPGPAAALLPHQDRHDYETLQNGQPVGTHYPGYTYDPGVIALCTVAPSCVATDMLDGRAVIDASLARPFTRLTGLCLFPAAGASDLTIELTDVLGGVSRFPCRSVFGGGSTFAVSSALPSVRAVFNGSPGAFWFDSLVFHG